MFVMREISMHGNEMFILPPHTPGCPESLSLSSPFPRSSWGHPPTLALSQDTKTNSIWTLFCTQAGKWSRQMPGELVMTPASWGLTWCLTPLSPPIPLRDPSGPFMGFLSVGGFRWSLPCVFVPPGGVSAVTHFLLSD